MKYYVCITPFFPSPNEWRGPYILDQVKAIKRTGRYEVIVIKTLGLKADEDTYEYDGITVYPIRSLRMPSLFFNGFGSEINGKYLLKKLRTMDIALSDIAVVHVHTATLVCYATSLKKANPLIKTVIQYHDPDPYQIRLGKFAHWKPNAMYRANKLIKQFNYIDLHLCISEKVKCNLLHFPIPHPDECYTSYLEILKVVNSIHTPKGLRTYVLYNGVDTTQFYPILGLKDKSIFKIGCIGNFVDLKDQITLIKAIELLVRSQNLGQLRVSFVGSGYTQESCQTYIKNKGLEQYFIFEKEMHHSDLNKYYNTLDLFVLPSYFEGFGCVFTEAVACGVPFMGCVNQGYSEYIPDNERDQWLINKGDYKTLAAHISSFICKGYSPIKYKYEFDINILVKHYLDYLDTSLS